MAVPVRSTTRVGNAPVIEREPYVVAGCWGVKVTAKVQADFAGTVLAQPLDAPGAAPKSVLAL